MKKSVFAALFILALVSTLFIMQYVSADLIDINPENPTIAGKSPDELTEISEKATTPGTAEQYIKGEYTKILEKSGFGRFLLKVSNAFTYLNFFWRPVLGVEYSLSWYFIFAVAIWLILFYILYGAMNVFFDNPIFGIIGGFVVASLIGMSGVIRKALDLLAFAVSNKWIAVICLVIAILIMYLIVMLSGGLKEYLKQQKETEEKSKTEKAQKIIQLHGKLSKEELEG